MEDRIELGSEFSLSFDSLNKVEKNLFSYMEKYETTWFDYGRSAIRSIPIPSDKKILLPEYICKSVTECFPLERICFYRINEDLEIDLEDLLRKIAGDVGVIYIVHYFGYLQCQQTLAAIRRAADDHKIIIIEDMTQSLFSEHSAIGDYIVASVRKWMAVHQGGILYTGQERPLPDVGRFPLSEDNGRVYGMVLKDLFLKEDYDTDLRYREIFASSEARVDRSRQPMRLSDLARYLIECVDIGELVAKRKDNMRRLQKGLEELGIQTIRRFDDNECPLVYPIRVRDRDRFRRYLMENRIYCAVHWPFDGIKEEQRSNAKINAETMISLPIDQRYGPREIDHMLDVICVYGGGILF